MKRICFFLVMLWAFATNVEGEETHAPLDPGKKVQEVKTFPAGYRTFAFSYKATDGTKREKKCYVWYPSAEKASKHEYKLFADSKESGQIGLVAQDSAVADGAHPVLVFSHGLWSRGDFTIFLMEALARAGYVVVAIDHLDASASNGIPSACPDFADIKTWTDKKYVDRKEDMSALLDFVEQKNKEPSSYLGNHLDSKKIGIIGHSLGGYTALALAGAWPSWRDERIRAALLLSPYCLAFDHGGAMKAVTIPVMMQGATLDIGITPFLPHVFESLSGPRYFMVLKNENHFAWTNLLTLGKTTTEAVEQGSPKLIVDYAVAFFDRHVQKKEAPLLDKKNESLARFEQAKAR